MLRSSSLGFYAGVAALGVLAVGGGLGCSAQTLDAGTVPPQTDAGAPGETTDAPSGTTPQNGAGCAVDGDCNAEATMSSQAGQCDQGRCRCRAGLYIVPGGKCGPKKGVGASCTSTGDCADGMECLDFTVHPKTGECSVVGKQCTIRCNNLDQQSACTKVLGPGILCFAGCTGTEGICGQTT